MDEYTKGYTRGLLESALQSLNAIETGFMKTGAISSALTIEQRQALSAVRRTIRDVIEKADL